MCLPNPIIHFHLRLRLSKSPLAKNETIRYRQCELFSSNLYWWATPVVARASYALVRYPVLSRTLQLLALLISVRVMVQHTTEFACKAIFAIYVGLVCNTMHSHCLPKGHAKPHHQFG
jgi:hypothetical protein